MENRRASIAEMPDCRALVPAPIEAAPFRSPQAVHTLISRHLVGKSVAEIGTSKGDGICCFAQVARSAVAFEMDGFHCRTLFERSRDMASQRGVTFSVACTDYSAVHSLDADVITWWADEPSLQNRAVLAALRTMLNSGRVRPTATAILVFDPKWPQDACDFDAFRMGLAYSFTEEVTVDESVSCLSIMASKERKLSRHTKRLCARANGTWHVMGIPVAAVPRHLGSHPGLSPCEEAPISERAPHRHGAAMVPVQQQGASVSPQARLAAQRRRLAAAAIPRALATPRSFTPQRQAEKASRWQMLTEDDASGSAATGIEINQMNRSLGWQPGVRGGGHHASWATRKSAEK